jgi:hypothetical protein
LTNKTFDTAGTGNSFSINGVAATANTGTGSVVRATGPTLSSPIVGTQSPSDNSTKAASTAYVDAAVAGVGGSYQPLDSDLTTIAGLTATTDNFMQAKSSAWASRTVAQVTSDLQGTGSSASSAGFRGLPVNSQSGAYTTVLSDVGKSIRHPSGGGAGDVFTIDSQANVAWPDGAALTFENRDSNSLSIAITTDTLRLAGAGTTGSRTLAQYGIATAVFDDATNEWLISGTGLT